MTRYLRTFLTRQAAGQFAKLLVIGVFNTVVDFALFNVFAFSMGMSLGVAIAVAFTIASIFSYLLNRRWTFGIRGAGSVTEGSGFVAVNVVALGLTEVVVLASDALLGPLSQIEANAAKFGAALLILVPKFAGYRDVVFRRSLANERRR